MTMASSPADPVVALLLPSFRVGGAERQALELARRLPGHGWQPRLLVCEGEGPLRAEADRAGLPWVPLGREFWRSKTSPLFHANFLRTLWRIRREVRRNGAAIVQSFLFWENQLAALACARHLLIQGRRDVGTYKDRRPWYQSVENLTNQHAARFVCNSTGVMEDALRREKLDRRRVLMIPNGVDTDHFRPAEASSPRRPAGARFVVGTVGNLKLQKRHDLFLRAVAEAARSVEGLHAIIVGDDRAGRRAELEALARDLGIADRVQFTGRADDVLSWLHTFDCFLLTSDHEGMPNVVLEAMATGLPVVSRPVEGIAELVVEGVTGHVADGPDLTRRLVDLAQLPPDARAALGRAGRDHMLKGFSLDVMAARYAALYNELIGRRP